MTLWERWKSSLERLKSTPRGFAVNVRPESRDLIPEKEKQEIKDRIKDLERTIQQHFDPKPSGNPARELNRQLEQLESHITHISATRHETERVINRLKDFRKQEDWADSWEKLRLFIFRLAAAIGFAAVVLATYWLAQKWNIPMPMRMPQI
ncbi:MAG: hypothetical protein CME38_18900 [Haliea sp.]|nr:hypothetical protein [Haliea sp.]|tara:strand:+ start:529 stop:981 length:453 start_codon:yes stop_codon:yes gene_type:complete